MQLRLYDRKCVDCEWRAIDVWEPSENPDPTCPVCQASTCRFYSKPPTAIGDACDFTQHNGTRDPIRFTSKGAFREWLQVNGYRVKDSHVGEQGSDRSKHTTPWATMSAETLENARLMLERGGSSRHDDERAPGITSQDGLIRYLRDRKAQERGTYV